MDQLNNIKLLEWIFLAMEFISLRCLRLLWVPEIADEENVEKKVVVITGGNVGLGRATAKKMAVKGATVVLACRNVAEGQKAIDEITSQTGITKEKMIVMKLDLADLNSVKEFSVALKKKFNAIHILINNAGVIKMTAREETTDGFELHMGVNHLGHFLLTNLLLDVLKKGAPSRVVTVSSHLIFQANLDIDDLMLQKTVEKGSVNTDSYLAYNNSKFANILFTSELAKRLEGTGVTCFAICPGLVATDVFRNLSWIQKLIIKIRMIIIGVSADVGCEATVYCSLSKKCLSKSGNVYHYNKELSLANKILAEPKSKKMAVELWEKSEKLVNLKKYLS